jgi:hypothetical protein
MPLKAIKRELGKSGPYNSRFLRKSLEETLYVCKRKELLYAVLENFR